MDDNPMSQATTHNPAKAIQALIGHGLRQCNVADMVGEAHNTWSLHVNGGRAARFDKVVGWLKNLRGHKYNLELTVNSDALTVTAKDEGPA